MNRITWMFAALVCCSLVNAQDVIKLYQQHCATCHGTDRLGAMGPALLPENLGRLKKAEASNTIAAGRAATQMPAFAEKITKGDIEALTGFIYTPLATMPIWDAAAIKQSQVIAYPAGSLGDMPVFTADPLNLFVVVELGDHHATILDGDKLEPLHRFKTRFALHGGPKYSPDGRFVYFASRDGWVSKFDLYNLKTVAEIRAGINTRNLAVSADGRFVMVGNYLPHTLVLLDARDLSLMKIIPVKDDQGKTSRVSAVYAAPPRKSFIAALKDIPEVWEIPYNDDAEPIYPGLVHDYKLKEGMAIKGQFGTRRIKLDDFLDDFFFDQGYQHLIGAARNGKNGQVVNLIVGRKIADIDLTGLPHLGSGISWQVGDKSVMATPNLQQSEISIIDMHSWKTIKRLKTDGPGFFMRSHPVSRYAWADAFMGASKDVVHIIDKDKLEIVKTLRPMPGKTAAHVEFDRYGKYALLSIWEMDGAIIVYDAATLEEVKRLPMVKPSGKYNVYNKTRYTEGTSH